MSHAISAWAAALFLCQNPGVGAIPDKAPVTPARRRGGTAHVRGRKKISLVGQEAQEAGSPKGG